jgi:hypothetical protein
VSGHLLSQGRWSTGSILEGQDEVGLKQQKKPAIVLTSGTRSAFLLRTTSLVCSSRKSHVMLPRDENALKSRATVSCSVDGDSVV